MTAGIGSSTFRCPACNRLVSVLGSKVRRWLGVRSRICGACAEKGRP